MIYVVSKIFSKQFIAMAIFPFIFLKEKSLKLNKVLLNHEKIHIRQQLELLYLPFFIWYLVEYFIRLIQTQNSKKAYHMISFEREAYENDHNLNYLSNRKWFSFLRYL